MLNRPRLVRGLFPVQTMSTDTIAPPTSHARVHPRHFLVVYLHTLFALALVLLLVLHGLTLVIPQQPSYIRTETEIHAWIRTAAASTPWVVQAAAVGATALLTSPLYRGVLLLIIALAVMHIFLALFLMLWPRPGTRVPPLSPWAAERGRFEHLTVPLAEAQAHVLRRLRDVTVVAEEHPSYQESRYFARGRMVAVWASVLFFVGMLVFALGLYVAAVFSWETPPMILAPGQSWDLGHGSGVRVSLLSAEEAGDRAGDLFLIQKESASEGQVYPIPSGASLFLGDMEIRHLDAPPGLHLQATTPAGVAVPLLTPEGHAGRNVVLVFPTSGDERTVLIPTYGLEVRVVGYSELPERGYAGQVFLLQVRAENREAPVITEFITDVAQIAVDGLTLQVTPVRHARVQARYTPGRSLQWVGLLMALGGMVVVLWRGPFRRVWVQLYSHDRGTIVQTWEDQYILGRIR